MPARRGRSNRREFFQFDVDRVVNDYIGMVSRAIGRELTWQHDDVALQNIQARARSPGVWLLANLRGRLLASTSNRSEAAVGYATMDGDTSGGISPIAGIDKAFLRRWLRWLETTGPQGLGPIPALHAVNVQEPTAELRPASAKPNRRSGLNALRIARRHRTSGDSRQAQPDGSVQADANAIPAILRPSNCWIGWNDFFACGVAINGSAERYAPSFHVDDENLDPKTWCRFPFFRRLRT